LSRYLASLAQASRKAVLVFHHAYQWSGEDDVGTPVFRSLLDDSRSIPQCLSLETLPLSRSLSVSCETKSDAAPSHSVSRWRRSLSRALSRFRARQRATPLHLTVSLAGDALSLGFVRDKERRTSPSRSVSLSLAGGVRRHVRSWCTRGGRTTAATNGRGGRRARRGSRTPRSPGR
jgi:hypothetical protein